MTKTICINQSNYIPWRGFFDLIRKSDEFVIADSVQYTNKDWCNRNQIKTRSGLLWLTVPVENFGRLLTSQRIESTRIADPRWAAKHIATFRHAYRGASCFAEVMDSPYVRAILCCVAHRASAIIVRPSPYQQP
jgi:hypothetical protein